jgi:hypothetical protein
VRVNIALNGGTCPGHTGRLPSFGFPCGSDGLYEMYKIVAMKHAFSPHTTHLSRFARQLHNNRCINDNLIALPIEIAIV